MQNKVTIKIPRELYHKLGQLIEGTGFSSVTEFVVFVMRSLTSDSEIRVNDKLTAEEVRAVRERLKILSYLKEEK
ncbi:MAG: CopG family transcriptional regulator [Dehalococcoidia bacterium]|nr:CopG family transcriptional regulator [Dehalococcoidia bacterium]